MTLIWSSMIDGAGSRSGRESGAARSCMRRDTKRAFRSGLFLGFMLSVSTTGLLTAQPYPGRASIGAYGGFAPNSGGAALLGFELRAFEGRRLAASLTASKWWRGTGCDQLVGIPCDDEALSADAGIVASLTKGSGRFVPYASARIGGLFYNSLDRGVWDPRAGVRSPLGCSMREICTSANPSGPPMPPQTWTLSGVRSWNRAAQRRAALRQRRAWRRSAQSRARYSLSSLR